MPSGAEMVQAVNNRLRVLLDECREDVLREAMAYSLFAGGKRLRPQILLCVSEAASGAYDSTALDFACAVEMIHTYSLIHDDLPAMDNDDFRRGLPTCHKVYGEATAILAGDALFSHAFEGMARLCAEAPNNRLAKAMYIIARGAGANGMVAGQVSDMRWENKKADESTLCSIQERKTGALITACAEAGAVLGGASDSYTRKAAELGRVMGLAFQIRDDILDVTAEAEITGKPAHSDEKNGKNTYVSVHGLEKARADYEALCDKTRILMNKLPQKTDSFNRLAERIINRNF